MILFFLQNNPSCVLISPYFFLEKYPVEFAYSILCDCRFSKVEVQKHECDFLKDLAPLWQCSVQSVIGPGKGCPGLILFATEH